MWHQSQFPTQHSAHRLQMRWLKMRLRKRQQIQCEFSFHSHFKDSLSKPIPRNHEHTLVPWGDLVLALRDGRGVWLGGDFLPIGRQHAACDFLRVRRFVEGKLFLLSDGPGPSLRDAMLVLSSANYMAIMAFCSWNVFRLFLLAYL